MRYAVARFKREQRDMAYRFYIAECLRITSENTAKFAGGKFMTETLAECLGALKPKAPEDTRTGDEIAADIIARAGIEVK